MANVGVSWVVTVPRYPILSDFAGTRGAGSPLVIDSRDGQAYFLSGTSIIALSQYAGPINPHWFGVLPSNSGAQNVAAWDLMLATLRARAKAPAPVDFYRTLGTIRFVDDELYNFNAALDIDGGSLKIIGCGPATRYSGTRLQWENTSNGFNIPYGNSSSTGTSGTWTHLQNLVLLGGWSGGVEADRHAINTSDRITVTRCTIKNWAGEAFNVDATSPTGNANNGEFFFNHIENTRTGLKTNGDDANNITSMNNEYNACREWAEWRSNFLGGVGIMPHTAECGITQYNDGVIIPATIVSHCGNRYYLKDPAGSTNAPSGTTASNTWWAYLNNLGVGAGAPAWFNGILVRLGGSLYVDNPNSATVYINPYTEGGQSPVNLSSRAIAIGGELEDGVIGQGVWIRNAAGSMTSEYLDILTRFRTYGIDTSIGPVSGTSDGTLHLTSPTNGLTIQWEQAGIIRGYDFCNAVVGRVIRGELVGVTLGHGASNVLRASTTGCNLLTGNYSVAGTQVVGPRGAAVPDPSGGVTVDIEARAAISSLLAGLRTHGLIAT